MLIGVRWRRLAGERAWRVLWRRRRGPDVGARRALGASWRAGAGSAAVCGEPDRGVLDVSCGGGRPTGAGLGQSERGESGEVDRAGEQLEVGVDLRLAAHARASSAVLAAHEVADLALDLGARGLVVGLPGGVGLAFAGARECGLVRSDADRASVG